MEKSELEKRIDLLEDNKIDLLYLRVEEIHKILVVGNGQEPLVLTVNKNSMRSKLLCWLVSVVYIAIVGAIVGAVVKGNI